MAPTFRDETASAAQGTINAFDHRIGALDPMQHSVAEHGVELLSKGQLFAMRHIRLKAECFGCFDLRCA